MNVQSVLRNHLQELFPDVPVVTRVPDPRPKKLIVVRRAGGGQENVKIDAPGIAIDMWAPTEQEAEQLAMDVSDAMFHLPFTKGFAKTTAETLMSDYDVLARSPRWYGSYTIKTFDPTNTEKS